MKIGRCIFVLIPVPRDLHNSAGADRRMWRTADDPKAAHDPPPPSPSAWIHYIHPFHFKRKRQIDKHTCQHKCIQSQSIQSNCHLLVRFIVLRFIYTC